MDSNGAILFSCAILFLLYFNSYFVYALDLSVYQIAQFTNPVSSSEFTRFTIHNETGTIYIGASDALYQLRPDFVKTHIVDTKVEECQSPDVVSCPNYNKIFVIDYINNTVITCGSENYVESDKRGTCNLRDVNDISTIVLQDDEQIVPPDPFTTEAIIVPGPDGLYMYVGVTYDERNRHPYIISRRLLSGQEKNILAANAFTSIQSTNANYASLTINFVHSFLYKEFTYFVTHQREEESPEFISKISRVCHGDDFDNTLRSFTEITLECQGQNGNIYNLIQAAYVGPAGLDLAMSYGIDSELSVLYGVFAKSGDDTNTYSVPSMQSALCLYKMDDIEAALFDAVAGCFGRNPGGTDSQEVAHQYKVNYLSGTHCPGWDITDDQVRGQLCSALQWGYAKGIVPLNATAVIEWTDITPSSIITTTHRNHTIAFVGTMQGDMVKVHIEDKDIGREYERFSVGSAVLRDAEFDEDQEQLTILTKQQIIKLNVSKCDEYATCDECIGSNGGQDGDPYCGWCTLERRCTRYDSCPIADVSTRWLLYNSAQCVDISVVAPYDSLPITLTEQQITLTVEQLPDLLDSSVYQCIFDSIPVVPATKIGNQLMCTTPAASDIPVIPDGEVFPDHVTMQLYVYSTETQVKFVQRDFYFYECDNHKGCMACTNSSWACDWCIYSNKCTHDNGTCSNEDDLSSVISGQNNPIVMNRFGPDECPQLIAQDREILIPVGMSSDIRVTGINLPDDNRINSYTCVLSIEGREVSTGAERNGDEITCESNMYTYDAAIQEMSARVSITWNNNWKFDDLHGFYVTLYKCEVQRPDCSRCLSNSTARPELMCGWCTADDTCTVSDGSQCSGDWLTHTGNQNCPAPVLSIVWPPSGPHEGNTIISVTGTDLGTQFTDVISITVGGQNCSTDGLGQKYLIGQSVSCRTMSGDIDYEGLISVTVQGKDGNLQESTGNIVFTYRDPSITSFEPIEGPEAGGTMVTIRGQYLDAYSHISASIGSAECRMDRMSDVIDATTAICYTTDAPVGTSEQLQVFFDGAMRQSVDMFTYRPNPTVTNVHPLSTIQSGGISLTVSGSGFDLAQGAQMILYEQNGKFQESCDVQNDTIMVCRTPDTRPPSVGTTRPRRQSDQSSFGFIIADVTDLLMWSEKNNVILANFPDPMYSTYPDPIEFSNIINIKGKNLNAGSTQDDVTVYIGEERAAINSLGASVLTITIPDQNPGRECVNGNTTDHPCIFVNHGNLEFYIGTVRYPKKAVDTLAIVLGVGITIVVFLAVLVAVAITYFVYQNRKLKKERDALILERLILLQKSVDETIDILSRESNSREAAQDKSIFLPNNVKINPEDVKIRFNELTMGRILGHGAFGEVFLADLQETEGNCIQVAVKSIQGKKDPSTIIKFLEEGLIMKDFDHPNVLGLIGLTFDPDGNPLVIIPLMNNGDLKSFLKKTTMEITTEQHLRFAIDAAKGMAYLAGKKFVHRDLAARNCMVDEDLVVKIGDFGRSREMEDDYEYISQDKKAKLPVKWMAPESIGYKRYNEKTDVWSFGILLWEIFTNGTKPYKSIANRDMYDYLCKGNRLPCPEGCRKDVYNIMLLCWNMNPKDRCTFQDLSQRLATILNLPSTGIEENQNKMAIDIDMGRDSYLHPIEQKETVGEEEEGTGDDYVNVSKQQAIIDNHGYTHLVGQHNAAVDLEMTSLN